MTKKEEDAVAEPTKAASEESPKKASVKISTNIEEIKRGSLKGSNEAESDEDDEHTPTLRPTKIRVATMKPVSIVAESVDANSSGEDGDEDQEQRPRDERIRLPTLFNSVKQAGPELDDDERSNSETRYYRRSFLGSLSFDDCNSRGSLTGTNRSRGSIPRGSFQMPDAPAGPVEAPDIEKHYVPDVEKTAKDVKLIQDSLRTLEFFKDIDADGISGLCDAMEVYKFEDGQNVCAQGNKTGTHFFIVSEGLLMVHKDGKVRAEIKPGAPFGESVILLTGEQTATVTSKGSSTIFGVRGTTVREVIKSQYQIKNQEINRAIEECLASGCRLLRNLTPYQVQALYDRAKIRRLADGDALLTAGQSPPDAVHVLIEGELVIRNPDAESKPVGRFAPIGDSEMLYQYVPATVAAEGEARTLVLPRELLCTMFGDHLEHTLVNSVIVGALLAIPEVASLPCEQLDAAASLAKVVQITPGEASEHTHVMLAVCLFGEITADVNAGKSHATPDDTEPWPASRTLEGATRDHFGVSGLLSLRRTCCLHAKASANGGTQAARLAIWRGDGLDAIVRSVSPTRKPSRCDSTASEGMDFQRSNSMPWASSRPSMKLAVLQEDRVGTLRKIVVFRTLAERQLKELADALEVEKLAAKEVLFKQGDPGNSFYIIHKGLVAIFIGDKKVRTLGTGDYVGERALLQHDVRTATVTAQEDSELWKMEGVSFHEILSGPILDYMRNRIAFQNTKVTLEDLECIRVVGRGGFGVVKMVQHKQTQTRYALKCLSKKAAVESGQQQALAIEKSILAELDHPFVIKYIRSFRGEQFIYFLMELVTGGELLDALDVLGLLKRFPAQFYVGSICLALSFLHERRIAYLDLKGENCLIDNYGYLKIIDFGVAERITEGRCHVVKGTPLFMAPEVIRCDPRGFTTSADLWSMGICMYDFMVGKFPFAAATASQVEIFRAVLKKELTFPKWFKDTEAKDLISRFLSRDDPTRRPGAGPDGYDELHQHDFFTDFNWDELLGRSLETPFKPHKETYAEDQEDAATESAADKQTRMTIAVSERDADKVDNDEAWVDPDPSWEEEFA